MISERDPTNGQMDASANKLAIAYQLDQKCQQKCSVSEVAYKPCPPICTSNITINVWRNSAFTLVSAILWNYTSLAHRKCKPVFESQWTEKPWQPRTWPGTQSSVSYLIITDGNAWLGSLLGVHDHDLHGHHTHVDHLLRSDCSDQTGVG